MAEWWEGDPVAQQMQPQPVEWWKSDPEVALDPREQAEADVRSGENPRVGGSFLGSERLGRLSDQVMDPFGVFDEMSGAGAFVRGLVTSGGSMDEAKKAYSEATDRQRAERRVARDENTVVPEIIGGFGVAGPAARIAAPIAQSLGSRIGGAAAVGGGTGAATGFAQGEGGVTNRLLGAAEGGAIGAVAGPLISEVAVPVVARTIGAVGDAARYGARAVANARNPERAAHNLVSDRMAAAGIDPAAVRAQVSPPPSPQLAGRNTPAGQPFNEEDMATIISRSMRGDTAAQIGADYGIHPSTVSRYVANYRQNNPTPMNIIDIAKETVGEGGAAPLARLGRATYSLAGDESGEAAQRLIGRQDTQPGRVGNVIQRSVAGGDFEATRAAGLQNMRDEAGIAYRQFYAEPDLATNQLGDLMEDPIFRRASIQAQRQARVDVIARNQQAARNGGPQEPVPQVDPGKEVFSPQELDNIQRQLRLTADGAVSNPNNARHARNLREVFLDRIEQHYPTFRDIRRNYATAAGEFGEEGALEAGAALTTKLGAPTREALRGFATMTPAQQGLFRLGFARKLMDMAADPQVGGAVANKFNTTSVREIVEQLYPRNDAQLWGQGQRLLRDLRREAITTRTKNDVTAGARTAELQSDMGRITEGAKTAADVLSGRFGKVLENMATRLTTQIGSRGARETLDLLTQTDPSQLLQTLNRLARTAQTSQQRQTYVTAIRALRRTNSRAVSGQVGINAGRERE
jgi:hypothetical protein